MSSTTCSPTNVIIRLAAELLVDGVAHPVAAAVARSARMTALAAPARFADRLAIDEFTLRRCESGQVAFDSLPVAYLTFVDGSDIGIDLASLRELAGAVDGRDLSVDAFDGGPTAVVLTFPGVSVESESVA